MESYIKDLLIAILAALMVQCLMFASAILSAYRVALAVTTSENARDLTLQAMPDLVTVAVLNTMVTALLGLLFWKLAWWGLGRLEVEPSFLLNGLVGTGVMVPFTGFMAILAGAIWGSTYWILKSNHGDNAREATNGADA
ncbi:MAG: hypothetical protein AAGL09_03165 [Pseudomonadota bacterium]